ncbi:MAG: hypothetical protein J6S83_06205, partial [Lachnospiraceae bacterium]|nr:hypothetical protein [Lachnospiraceae bacterium]
KVTSLLLASLTGTFREVFDADEQTGLLFGYLKEALASAEDGDAAQGTFTDEPERRGKEALERSCSRILARERTMLEQRVAAGQGKHQLFRREGAALEAFEAYVSLAAETGDPEVLKAYFGSRREELEKEIASAGEKLENAFDFMEKAFGESQEMVVFITELSMNRYASWLLGEYDCDRYYMYNRNLLFNEREQAIREQLEMIRELQVT